MAHTKEPWSVPHMATAMVPGDCQCRWILSDPYCIATISVDNGLRGVDNNEGPPLEEAKDNARRIVACVNACADINPEAVPDLVKACCGLMAYIAEKYPGEPLRCPHMQAIAAAMQKAGVK